MHGGGDCGRVETATHVNAHSVSRSTQTSPDRLQEPMPEFIRVPISGLAFLQRNLKRIPVTTFAYGPVTVRLEPMPRRQSVDRSIKRSLGIRWRCGQVSRHRVSAQVSRRFRVGEQLPNRGTTNEPGG